MGEMIFFKMYVFLYSLGPSHKLESMKNSFVNCFLVKTCSAEEIDHENPKDKF